MTHKEISEKSNIKKGKVFETFSVIFLLLVTVVYMYLFAFNNSPFVSRIGEDGGMYLVISRGLLKGAPLYTGLFDHKGPIIFFINALPQLFYSCAASVWVFECIFVFLSMLFIYKTARIITNNSFALLSPVVYLWSMTSIFNGGNYTEEYGNLFCIICLYFFACWLKARILSKKQAFLMGVCTALVFFMRPNNTALILAIVLFIGIYTLKNQPGRAKNYIFFGTLGILAVTLPIFAYHISQGNLGEMLNATFLHNLKYCGTGWKKPTILFEKSRYMIFVGIFLFFINLPAIMKCISKQETELLHFTLLSLFIIVMSISVSGRAFSHYWVLLAPITAFSAAVIFKGEKDSAKKAIILSILLVSVGGASTFGYLNIDEKRQSSENFKADSVVLLKNVPKSEQSGIFGYDVPAVFFYINDITPPFKYFTMQNWMSKTNSSITDACCEYLLSSKPKWVIDYYKPSQSDKIQKILDKSYTCVDSNNAGTLYCIK